MKNYLEDLIDIHINGQLHLYASNVIEKGNYKIILSDLIDDQYWNYAYLKNGSTNLNQVWENIKEDMKKNSREPVIYVTSNCCNKELEQEIKNINLECLYTDIWMTIEDLENFKDYKSKLNLKVTRVGEDLKSKFVQAIMDGFSGDNPDDPYESLSDGYKIALEQSMEKNDSQYKIINYAGIFNEEVIATATVLYKGNKAIIYNITTNKKFQKQGVCKQMMSEIIEDLNEIRNHLDKHFVLNNDIVFDVKDFEEGGAFYNEGKGWIPIGDATNPFTGTFDGQGHYLGGNRDPKCFACCGSSFFG